MVGHIVNSYFYFLHNLCFLEVNNHCFFIACFASVVVVQLLSPVQLFVTPWIAAHQASLSFSISWSLLKLMSIELVMLSNHLILPLLPISSHPLLLLLSIFPGIRVFFFFFFNESALCIRWPKYWSFIFSISLPMNIQGWFPLGLTGLISLQSKGFSRIFSNTTV